MQGPAFKLLFGLDLSTHTRFLHTHVLHRSFYTCIYARRYTAPLDTPRLDSACIMLHPLVITIS